MSDETPKKKYPTGKHPNSLAALGMAWNSETAKEAQLLGAKKRSENAARRKAMKESLNDWKMMKEHVLEDGFSAVDTLRLLLAKALHDENYDIAADLASKLAEYEKPKLARVESKVEEVKADDLTDEELDAKLEEMMSKSKTA